MIVAVVADGAHAVADGQHPGHGPTRRVDEQPDVGMGVLGGQQEQTVAEPVAVALLERVTQKQGALVVEGLVQGTIEGVGWVGVVAHGPTVSAGNLQREERAAVSSAARSSPSR